MSALIECVPNFSEGADTSLIEEIVAAVKTAKVLDLHSDPDHNRSVVTMIGSPDEVKQAAFDLTERAMQLLDIRKHKGEHPYVGVVDVVPFIPIKNTSVEETIQLAREFGQKVAAELALPVYFYGEINHKELPAVRKGGSDPDLGKGRHSTAGAVAVGVRDYLIAFNINLNTRDLNIAESIAGNIREKNGGLPGVRALGVDLESRGLTQVSINLVDHKKTSLKQIFDSVNRWSKEYGVGIVESELVGLLPRSAVFSDMKEYLKLSAFSDRQILDNHLPA